MLCYFTRPIAYYYIVLVFVFFTKEQNIKKCIRDVSIFFTLVKYLVSIYGLKMINKENYRIFIFFGLFILINLLLTSSFGSARYRLPYEILLIIIFSSGLRNLFKLTKLLTQKICLGTSQFSDIIYGATNLSKPLSVNYIKNFKFLH